MNNVFAVNLTLLAFFVSTKLYAQHSEPQTSDVITSAVSSESAGYINPSKIKQSLTNVDLFTGIAQPSISIFNYSSNGIPVNLSLNYNGSGVKVNDLASPAGTGWTLNTGYKITRIINGNADDLDRSQSKFSNEPPSPRQMPGGYFSSPDLPLSATAQDKKNYYLQNWDSEIDVFTLSMPKGSVQFVIGKDQTVMPLSPTEFKIEFQTNSNFGSVTQTSPTGKCIDKFTVIDGEGNKYYFEAKKINGMISFRISNFPWFSWCYTCESYKGIDEWDIVKIEPYKGASIFYTYDPILGPSGEVAHQVAYLGNARASCRSVSSGSECWHTEGMIANNGTWATYGYSWYGAHILQHYLTKIATADGIRVDIDYSTENRCDMEEWESQVVYDYRGKSISEIKVYDHSKSLTSPQYSYAFKHSYFNVNSPTGVSPFNDCLVTNNEGYFFNRVHYRLKLDEIEMFPSNLGIKYAFEYDLSNALKKWSSGYDHYGYHNGKHPQDILPSDDGLGNIRPNSGDRRPDPFYSKMYSLKKVIINNQAEINYTYEGHIGRIFDHQTQNLLPNYNFGGGLRIKQISVFDGIDHANDLNTYYSYVNNSGLSSGMIFCKPVYSKPFNDNVHGQSIYLKGSSMVNAWGFTKNGASCGYSVVTVSRDPSSTFGKEIYEFTNIVDGSNVNVIPNTDQLTPFVNGQSIKSWRIGLLKKKEVYAGQQLFPKLTEEYQYDIMEYPLAGNNYNSVKMEMSAGHPNGMTPDDPLGSGNGGNFNDFFDWELKEYKTWYSSVKQSKVTQTRKYVDANNVVHSKSDVTTYTYDSHREVKTVEQMNGPFIKTTYYRAYDYNPTINNSAIADLISSNRQNTIIRVDKNRHPGSS